MNGKGANKVRNMFVLLFDRLFLSDAAFDIRNSATIYEHVYNGGDYGGDYDGDGDIDDGENSRALQFRNIDLNLDSFNYSVWNSNFPISSNLMEN